MFKQKTAYEMRIRDWSSDVCSSDLLASGVSVVYGDASRREVLVAAGLSRAQAIVVTYSDLRSSMAILRHARELRPDLPVVVRTIDDTHQIGSAPCMGRVCNYV